MLTASMLADLGPEGLEKLRQRGWGLDRKVKADGPDEFWERCLDLLANRLSRNATNTAPTFVYDTVVYLADR